LRKGGNCEELLLKSFFEKGGFKNHQAERIYDNRYNYQKKRDIPVTLEQHHGFAGAPTCELRAPLVNAANLLQ
jgi:hypothetical protein